MSLTKNRYDEKIQRIGKDTVYDDERQLKQYDKEFKEFEKNHDRVKIYQDLSQMKRKSFKDDINRYKFLR